MPGCYDKSTIGIEKSLYLQHVAAISNKNDCFDVVSPANHSLLQKKTKGNFTCSVRLFIELGYLPALN
jgi:hypothetical protein